MAALFHETSFQPRSSARMKRMLGCLAREAWQEVARFMRRRSMAARGPGVTVTVKEISWRGCWMDVQSVSEILR